MQLHLILAALAGLALAKDRKPLDKAKLMLKPKQAALNVKTLEMHGRRCNKWVTKIEYDPEPSFLEGAWPECVEWIDDPDYRLDWTTYQSGTYEGYCRHWYLIVETTRTSVMPYCGKGSKKKYEHTEADLADSFNVARPLENEGLAGQGGPRGQPWIPPPPTFHIDTTTKTIQEFHPRPQVGQW